MCNRRSRDLHPRSLSVFPVLIATPKPPTWVSWHLFRVDEFILNVDGSCLGEMRKVGFEGLVRKGDGSWIIGFSGFLGISNNIVVELMAMYHGLKMARNLGYYRIICYSDSQNVFDLISEDHNPFHYYIVVMASIKDLLKLKWDVILYHYLIEGNFSAYFLAKVGSTNDKKNSLFRRLLHKIRRRSFV